MNLLYGHFHLEHELFLVHKRKSNLNYASKLIQLLQHHLALQKRDSLILILLNYQDQNNPGNALIRCRRLTFLYHRPNNYLRPDKS